VIPLWLALAISAVALVVVGVDFVGAVRRPHVVGVGEALAWVGIYSALAIAFAIVLVPTTGAEASGQFVAGWLTEYSLSVDNLFVFAALLAQFAVPRELQNTVLLVGILIALVLRACIILLGVTLLDQFGWMFYVFGFLLLATAIRQLAPAAGGPDGESRIGRMLRRWLRVSTGFDGLRLTTRVEGKRLFTPMALTFVAIGVTDLLFALDSIPAVLGITHDAFLVVATNFFALMGLRQLYVLIRALLERVAYLGYGIAVILGFIACKLVFAAMATNSVPFINRGHPVGWAPEIGVLPTLVVIVSVLLATAVASGVQHVVVSKRAAARASEAA
jgi:tellurite resistance protein TerC